MASFDQILITEKKKEMDFDDIAIDDTMDMVDIMGNIDDDDLDDDLDNIEESQNIYDNIPTM